MMKHCQAYLNVNSVIALNTIIGNYGNFDAVNSTLAKSIIIPDGVQVKVIDNGGADIGPMNGDILMGPVTAGFIFTGITLPERTSNGVTVQSLDISLQVISAVGLSPVIIDTSTIIHPSDGNTLNNSESCSIIII